MSRRTRFCSIRRWTLFGVMVSMMFGGAAIVITNLIHHGDRWTDALRDLNPSRDSHHFSGWGRSITLNSRYSIAFWTYRDIVALRLDDGQCRRCGILDWPHEPTCPHYEERGAKVEYAGAFYRDRFDTDVGFGPVRYCAGSIYDGRSFRDIRLSIWLVMILTALYPLRILWRTLVVERIRLRRGLCIECGYDLSGTPSDCCSECGSLIKQHHSSDAPPAHRFAHFVRNLLDAMTALLIVIGLVLLSAPMFGWYQERVVKGTNHYDIDCYYIHRYQYLDLVPGPSEAWSVAAYAECFFLRWTEGTCSYCLQENWTHADGCDEMSFIESLEPSGLDFYLIQYVDIRLAGWRYGLAAERECWEIYVSDWLLIVLGLAWFVARYLWCRAMSDCVRPIKSVFYLI